MFRHLPKTRVKADSSSIPTSSLKKMSRPQGSIKSVSCVAYWVRCCILWGCAASACAACVLFLDYVYKFAYRSNCFKIRSIEIRGAKSALEAEINRYIEIQRHISDENLVCFNANVLKLKFCDQPQLNSLNIRKLFPGKLVVEFDERSPVAVAYFNQLVLIDKEGLLLGEATFDQIEANKLPIITGIQLTENQQKELKEKGRLNRPINSPVLRQVLLASLLLRDDPNLVGRIVAWNIDAQEEITAILDSRTEVLFGHEIRPQRLAELSAAFESEKYQARLAKALYIDLRIEKQIVLR